ncbi:MAG: hypothetical protein KAT04_14915 [Methylococcales bacterium]|nr:hypothetical protein [Methylococcales bacterium]
MRQVIGLLYQKKNTDESDIKTNLKKPQTTQQHKQHRTKRLPEPQGTMTNAFAKALKK